MKPTKMNQIISPDVFFYTIPLENDNLILSKEILFKHYQRNNEEQHFRDRATVGTVSYSKDLFTIPVSLPKEKKSQLYVHIERYEIYIACDCGMPGQILCRHAYYGLFYLMHYKDMNLKPYFWPGLLQEEKDGYKYLDVYVHGHHIDITPKKQFGNLYKVGVGFSTDDQLSFGIKKSAKDVLGNKEILGYAVIYSSPGYRGSHYTFLCPFIGKTSKNGQSIKAYHQYLRRDKHFKHALQLSNNQIMLNERCFDMFEIVKGAHKSNSDIKNLNWVEVVAPLLNIWQKSLTQLLQETNVVACHNYYGLKYWEDKPKKIDMHPCKITSDKITISFVLKQRKEDFILTPTISTPLGVITDYSKISLFIIDNATNKFFLVNSVQDEMLLNWLKLYSFRLTILKDHMIDFQSRFLNQINDCYEVFFQPFGSKGKINYQDSLNIIS